MSLSIVYLCIWCCQDMYFHFYFGLNAFVTLSSPFHVYYLLCKVLVALSSSIIFFSSLGSILLLAILLLLLLLLVVVFGLLRSIATQSTIGIKIHFLFVSLAVNYRFPIRSVTADFSFEVVQRWYREKEREREIVYVEGFYLLTPCFIIRLSRSNYFTMFTVEDALCRIARET